LISGPFVDIGNYRINYGELARRALAIYYPALADYADEIAEILHQHFGGHRIKWDEYNLPTVDREAIELVRLRTDLWTYSFWSRLAQSDPDISNRCPISTLRTDATACMMATELSGSEWPTPWRPLLPLEGCSTIPCGCDFVIRRKT
jgi:hypothetical protein